MHLGRARSNMNGTTGSTLYPSRGLWVGLLDLLGEMLWGSELWARAHPNSLELVLSKCQQRGWSGAGLGPRGRGFGLLSRPSQGGSLGLQEGGPRPALSCLHLLSLPAGLCVTSPQAAEKSAGDQHSLRGCGCCWTKVCQVTESYP